AEHVAVVVGEEASQPLVLLGEGARQHADEGGAAAAIQRQRQGRADEGAQYRLQPRRRAGKRRLQRLQAPCAQLVQPAAEHLVDQVVLGTEVVIDRREVDVGAAGDLPQGGRREAVFGEQGLGGGEDAVLGGEVAGIHGAVQTFVWSTVGRRWPRVNARAGGAGV